MCCFGPRGQVAVGKGLWLSRGLKAPRPRPPGSLGLGPLNGKKLAFPLQAGRGSGGGTGSPPLEEEGRREESSRACRERECRAPRAGPLGSGFGPLRIQPSFQVFSRPGPACSRLSRAPPHPVPAPSLPRAAPLGQVCGASQREPGQSISRRAEKGTTVRPRAVS